LLDFVVWLVVTLDAPRTLNTLVDRILVRFASRENIAYLYADVNTLVRRADFSRGFIVRELTVYSILAKYFAKCSIDTGRNRPARVVAEAIQCPERRRQ
jgi:hypothetical protein